ncbi:MAG: DUF167 domain-containing protein [Chloroflexota bacterium]
MSAHKFQFGKGSGGSALSIKVTPRARKNEIVGVMADGTLKIRVTAPPVGGKANEAVIELLADVLNVPKSKIEIVAGETSTQKLVSIADVTPAQVEELLRSVAREDGED